MFTCVLMNLFLQAYFPPTTFTTNQMPPECEYDFVRSNDTGRCIDCPLGYFGRNCVHPCPYPRFGRRCLDGECNCSRELCNIASGCMSVEAKYTTILTTQLGNSGKDNTINGDSVVPLANFQTTKFVEVQRKTIKPNLINSDRDEKFEGSFYQKPKNHRYTNYVSVILITFLGTSVSVLLIVAIGYQIWSKMYKNREQKPPRHLRVTSDPEQGGIYNEINNVVNN